MFLFVSKRKMMVNLNFLFFSVVYFVKWSLTFSIQAKRDFVCLIFVGVADGGNILRDLFRWMELNSKSKHRRMWMKCLRKSIFFHIRI